MAWIDILIGFLLGIIASIVLARRFSKKPIITIIIIMLFILIGIAFSDLLLTTQDKPWNILDRIVTFFLNQTAPQ